MAKWIAKAAVQRAISMLPWSQSWNYVFQRHLTKSLDLGTVWFQRRLRECRWHLENYFQTNADVDGAVLELGTGWYPTIPLSFWLCGISRIVTIDIQPVLRPQNLKKTFQTLVAAADSGELRKALPWVKEDRISVLRKMAEEDAPPVCILGELGIEALLRDGRSTRLESGSIDFFFSNGVLHEIPEHVLMGMFDEFGRLASPNAVMSHYILMEDLYSTFDSSITRFNFLKYPDWMWGFINNRLNYHNRLRISDYRRIHKTSGFPILYEHGEQGKLAELESVSIAKKFRH